MIKIRSPKHKVHLDEAETIKIQKSLDQCLDRLMHKIRCIEVGFVDLNGPKGGLDMRCSLRVSLVPRGQLFVHHSATSALEAAQRAGEKLSTALTRKLGKRLSTSRRRLRASEYMNQPSTPESIASENRV